MDLDWLEPLASRWRRQVQQGRAPHAVLLLGAAGTGKRAAAAWLARERLGPAETLPRYPFERPVHPDLHWLSRLEDKHTIVIEQVRELIHELSLTSHEGRGKVAVIEPAGIMTRQAANSLLKTLEEPPGDSLIVLVADGLSHLPATILSRCQRLPVPLPPTEVALTWLERVRPGTAWAPALDEAGGAPLKAFAALERMEETASMRRDLAALATRSVSPVDVAERWLKADPGAALDWLALEVQACIRRRFGISAGPSPALDDSVLARMDTRNLFCYLDSLNRLRGQASGSFNPQLTLEALLIDWADGLAAARREPDLRALWA